jgi:hypothetical protein
MRQPRSRTRDHCRPGVKTLSIAILASGVPLLSCGGQTMDPGTADTAAQSGSGPSGTTSSSGAGSSATPSPCGAGASGVTGGDPGDDAPTRDASGSTVTITFSGVSADFGPSYTESGFTVSPTSGGWLPLATYGNPAPFIEFTAAAGSAVTGAIQVTAGGSTFGFESVDLYSSTTAIPYAFVGMRNCTIVFNETNTLPNTFGTFGTVVSQHPTAIIDTLTITLTNPAAPCCENPMGLDNIVLSF